MISQCVNMWQLSRLGGSKRSKRHLRCAPGFVQILIVVVFSPIRRSKTDNYKLKRSPTFCWNMFQDFLLRSSSISGTNCSQWNGLALGVLNRGIHGWSSSQRASFPCAPWCGAKIFESSNNTESEELYVRYIWFLLFLFLSYILVCIDMLTYFIVIYIYLRAHWVCMFEGI